MDARDILSRDPEIMSGALVFKGTRVPVDTLFQYLSAGDTLSEFLTDFPTVEKSQAQAALDLAKERLMQRFEGSAIESAA